MTMKKRNFWLASILLASPTMVLAEPSMTENDWQTVQQGLFDDNGTSYVLDLFSVEDFSSVSLVAGDSDEILMGYRVGDKWMFTPIPQGADIATECWNPQRQAWVSDRGNKERNATFEGNEIHTVYSGTGIPVTMRITPYQTKSQAWKNQLKQFPASLKLTALQWPAKAYRVETAQQQDVLCRFENEVTDTVPDQIHSVDDFTSASIVSTLFSEYYPDHYTVTKDSFALDDISEYQWHIEKLSNGVKLLALTDTSLNDTGMDQEPDYYMIQNRQIFQVQPYPKFSYDQQKHNTRLTFSASFATQLRQHLQSL